VTADADQLDRAPCPKCGRLLDADANYCPACGHRLGQTIEQPYQRIALALAILLVIVLVIGFTMTYERAVRLPWAGPAERLR
jgi:uncharacterized paraquat-inducible protein A